MPFFDSDGVKIHYLDQGGGAPVLLIHGFGSSADEHWVRTGMVDRLARRPEITAQNYAVSSQQLRYEYWQNQTLPVLSIAFLGPPRQILERSSPMRSRC